MISFIIPAHNEELFLPKTLESVHKAVGELNVPYEIIVVDDSSTDRTSVIAREMGARVIHVKHRQIAATRNAGARAACGDQLFFIDADTTVSPRALSSAVKRLATGVAGGGALTYFEDKVPLYARLLLLWLGVFMRIASLSGGAFLFCTKRAFAAAGGFDERLYGAEDAALSAALKKAGRFVVLPERVPTSGRRVRSVTGLSILGLMVQIAIAPSNLKERKNVERIWYVSDRSSANASHSFLGRISNFCALLIMLVLVSIPIWAVPWPKSLLAGPLGQLKHLCGTVVAHVGLVLWPCSFFLSQSFFEQKQIKDRFKTALLILICVLLAFGSSIRVLEFWRTIVTMVLHH